VHIHSVSQLHTDKRRNLYVLMLMMLVNFGDCAAVRAYVCLVEVETGFSLVHNVMKLEKGGRSDFKITTKYSNCIN